MKGTKKNYKNDPKTINKVTISTYLSIITLNVNELNAPIKRLRVAKWIQKKRLINMLPTSDSHQI